MAWRELSIDADEDVLVFTTADLRWQPLVSEDPDGAQIAMLWGDRHDRAFGAVVHSPKHPPGVYTLVRRSGQESHS